MRTTTEQHPKTLKKTAGIKKCDTCGKEEYRLKAERWDVCVCCARKQDFADGRRTPHRPVKRVCYINYCECCKKVFEVRSKWFQNGHTNQPAKYCSVSCRNQGSIGRPTKKQKHDRKDMHPRLKAMSETGINEISWMKNIMRNRGFKCELTGAIGVALSVHHLKPFHSHPELQFDESNVVVMRTDLHKRFHINVMGGWAKKYTIEDWDKFVAMIREEYLV